MEPKPITQVTQDYALQPQHLESKPLSKSQGRHFSIIEGASSDSKTASNYIKETHSVNQEVLSQKKKKKKKVTQAAQQAVIEKLGDAFVLPKSAQQASGSPGSLPQQETVVHSEDQFASPSSMQQASRTPARSVFAEPLCPALDSNEKALLTQILQQNNLWENMNLLEVFLCDFCAQWETILSLAKYNEQLKKLLTDYNSKDNLVYLIFDLYRHLLVKEKGALFIESFQCLNTVEFNKDRTPGTIERLNTYSDRILALNERVEEYRQATNTRFKSCKKIIAKNDQNSKGLSDNLSLLNQKVELFKKCLKTKDCETADFFVKEKIGIWIESFNSNKGRDPLIKCANFFNRLLNILKEQFRSNNRIFLNFEQFLAAVNQLISTNYSVPSIENIINIYKLNSSYSLKTYLEMKTLYEESITNPSFLENPFCVREGIRSKKEATSCITGIILVLAICDKWVNDIAVNCRSVAELQEMHFITPKIYLSRLLQMFDLLSKKDVSIEENLPTDPFLLSLNDLVKERTTEAERQFQTAFAPVSFPEIATSLRRRITTEPFQLSMCLHSLSPIHLILQTCLVPQLNQIHQRVLQLVRTAREGQQINHWTPLELKNAIQTILSRQTLQLCIYTMITADTKALFSGSCPQDIMHLLPDDMVRLLTLSGFDDIFQSSPAAVVELVDDTPTEPPEEPSLQPKAKESEEKKPPVVIKMPQISSHVVQAKPTHVKKQQKTPDKQDFINAHKRGVIERILRDLGITYHHTARHDVFIHTETLRKVTVPHNVGARGTRLNIYAQARQAVEGKGV